MKFISAIILTAFLGYAAGLFSAMPWFCFAITSFVVAIAIPQRPWKSFVTGFIALFLLWTVLVIFIDHANQHILSTRIANLFPLGGSYWVLILVTAVLGGLVSGFAALAGSFVRKRKAIRKY